MFKPITPGNTVEYFGIALFRPTNRVVSYIATDIDGRVYGYSIEPIFDEDIGVWGYEVDDPKDFRIYEYYSKIEYEGECSESLQSYI
jgi:hypothetical protein